MADVVVFIQDLSTLATKLEMLKTNIANTQSLIVLKLNDAQNKLLNVNTIFTFCNVYVACGSAIAAFFGESLCSML